MEKTDNYFICITKDDRLLDFGKRCNNVDKWNDFAIIFKETNLKNDRYVALAIIPIEFIKTIENINAPNVR